MPAGNEYYQNQSEPVVDLYSQIENDILDNIAKRLGKDKNLLKRTEENPELIVGWRNERLNEENELRVQNAKSIRKYNGVAQDEIERIFKETSESQTIGTEANFNNAIEAGANLANPGPIDESNIVQNILESAINNTKTTFGGIDSTMLRQASLEYTAAVNAISAQVLSGQKTAAQAASQVVTKLSENGITGFIRSNNTRMSVEAYSNLIMRANTKNTVTAIQEQRALEYGNDYIEVNAYSGARPKCSIDQGGIYSRSGNTRDIEDLDGNKISVKAWGSTSFGEPDGILGINCGHQRFDFIPGFSTQDKVKINQRENTRQYKEKQLQRLYERNIRKAKREKSMLESANATKESVQNAQTKISNAQKTMREFIKETGRTRRPDRERIGLPA